MAKELRLWDDWFKKTRTLVVVYVLSCPINESGFTSGWQFTARGLLPNFVFLRELSLDPALQRRESLGLFPSRPSHMSLDIYPYYMGSTPMLHAYFGCQIRAEGPMLLHGGRQYVRRAEAPAVQE